MKAEATVAIRIWSPVSAVGEATAAMMAEPATSTEAAPPKPLKRPTSSGMEVILTRMAATAPMSDPAATPMRMYFQS